MSDLAAGSGAEFEALVERALHGGVVAIDENPRKLPGSTILRRVHFTTGRLAAVAESRYVAVQLAAVGIFLFLLLTGSAQPVQDIDWAPLMIYSAALLAALVQFAALASAVANVGRFYPALESFRSAVDALRREDDVAVLRQKLQRAVGSGRDVDLEDDF
jgi:hypothetical protein